MSENTVRLHVTSSAFAGENGRRNFEECQAMADKFHFELGIQVHNTAPESVLQQMAQWGVPMSVHAPVTGEFYLNLAAEDFSGAQEAVLAHKAYLEKFHIRDAVFHGFMMTDIPVPNFGRGLSYNEALGRIFRPELSYDGRGSLNKDFTRSEEFLLRRERVKNRLAQMAEWCPDIRWHIENDFPAYGSGNMLASDAAALEHELCLDFSHLWTTAYLFDLDFQQEVQRFFDTGKVRMTHLHVNAYDEHTPKLRWSDGHLPLAVPNQMDLPRIVKAGREAKVDFWVLEVVKATAEDVRIFGEMWHA